MSKSRLSALAGYMAGFLPNPALAMRRSQSNGRHRSRNVRQRRRHSDTRHTERRETRRTHGAEELRQSRHALRGSGSKAR